ncbi:MAG: hypothetical protein AB7S75_15255 [Desulfococcaceae bacterium]
MNNYIELRKIRCLDGLHYSFEILEYFYSHLYEICCLISEDYHNVVKALASCWGFIDALHRIREIAQSTPGINVKHKEMRAFLNDTKIAEEYRHYIQHLRGELANNPPNTFPVWGAISWVDPKINNKCHIAIFGAQIKGTNFSSCVYDTLNNEWVSKVCLGVGEKSFNFDIIYKAVEKIRDYLIPAIIEGASKEIKFHDKLPIMTVEFRRNA